MSHVLIYLLINGLMMAVGFI